MAQKITPREKDFSQWYQDVVLNAELADYSPVKGCMVIRPRGYSLWEHIQKDLDQRIRAVGARNAYFPLFIPESFLKKEAEHVEGFAPQCAVVTHAGGKELEEKLVVRPTSETVINSMFAKWIQSYRDLPLKINQWANVVRWEMRTRLFLRTTEFLWQEGHTCHATAQEAEVQAQEMVRVYQQMAEDLLGMPVIAGRKSESEKFAGALRTYTIEAMMQDRKALQAGTSHNLSTHFAEAFGTVFLDQDGKQKPVHQTSWGVSTRLIGGMIMTHSDDRGLVLPPRIASIHVVIVPILSQASSRESVLEAAEKMVRSIQQAAVQSDLPYKLEVHLDRDETKQPGWKFHEYELQGVPCRVEVGPRDLDRGEVILARRDQSGQKKSVSIEALPEQVVLYLKQMQADLLSRARQLRDASTFRGLSYADFQESILNQDGGFYILPWCQSLECEAQVKKDTHATLRCLPVDDECRVLSMGEPCAICRSKSQPSVQAIFARNY